MATVLVVVVDVQTHEADEMPLAEDDHVLEELATTAPDPPLGGSVLPWAAIRDANGIDAERPHERHDRAEDCIAIEDQILRRRVVW